MAYKATDKEIFTHPIQKEASKKREQGKSYKKIEENFYLNNQLFNLIGE